MNDRLHKTFLEESFWRFQRNFFQKVSYVGVGKAHGLPTVFLLGLLPKATKFRTVEDASPYKCDGILNLGDTPYDAIMV